MLCGARCCLWNDPRARWRCRFHPCPSTRPERAVHERRSRPLSRSCANSERFQSDQARPSTAQVRTDNPGRCKPRSPPARRGLSSLPTGLQHSGAAIAVPLQPRSPSTAAAAIAAAAAAACGLPLLRLPGPHSLCFADPMPRCPPNLLHYSLGHTAHRAGAPHTPPARRLGHSPPGSQLTASAASAAAAGFRAAASHGEGDGVLRPAGRGPRCQRGPDQKGLLCQGAAVPPGCARMRRADGGAGPPVASLQQAGWGMPRAPRAQPGRPRPLPSNCSLQLLANRAGGCCCQQ